MNQNSCSMRAFRGAFLFLIIFLGCFGAARAQSPLTPFVDCVEREYNSGAATGYYIAYFGYRNATATEYIIPRSLNNFFEHFPDPSKQPTRFAPGVHQRVVAVTIPIGQTETWNLGYDEVTVSFTESRLCNSDGANSRLITYQGRLSDGAAAANGLYDLRLQLFNAATGGAARTTPILLEDVAVANGVFTVRLDLGANSLPPSNPGVPVNLNLNPAILDAEDSFLEIAVRAGTSTGAFTTLAPRQPLTAVPLAMRAASAATAARAVYADKAADAANAVNAINAANATNATNATNVSGGFVQLPLTNGAPPASECGNSSQYGRQKVDASSVRLYICTAAGWKFTALQ